LVGSLQALAEDFHEIEGTAKIKEPGVMAAFLDEIAIRLGDLLYPPREHGTEWR
jgi:hypothetical protein